MFRSGEDVFGPPDLSSLPFEHHNGAIGYFSYNPGAVWDVVDF